MRSFIPVGIVLALILISLNIFLVIGKNLDSANTQQHGTKLTPINKENSRLLISTNKLSNPLDESLEEQDINKVQWWKKTTYYHIYVRSFRDSNNDGQGDLRGILEKLDYLKWLGAETLLMTPICASTMHDNGYDITNYTDINPLFGTMKDFDDLLAGLKKRHMRIIFDFVANHVSTEHEWFKCSERALIEPERCGKYRDWFIWNNSTRFEGKYPTNWVSVFGGGPAWHRSPIRNEFYLHQFLPEQADLNMSNPEVREELNNVVRFWFKKGVDGLRIDAMPFYLEDYKNWTDEVIDENWLQTDNYMWPYYRLKHDYTNLYNGTAEIVRDWYRIAKEEFDGDRLIVNEAYGDMDPIARAHGSSHSDRYTDLNFAFYMLNIKPEGLSPEMISNKTMAWFNATQALNWPRDRGTINPWLIWSLDNHDRARRINVMGEKYFDIYQWIGFMLPGSPTVYYGDEIGTHHANEEDIPEKTKLEGELTRLTYRALMAWTPDEPSAGFSNRSDNWMPLARNYKTNNVQAQLATTKPYTHLKNYIAMQQLRKTYLETFVFGDVVIYKNVDSKNEQNPIFAMARVHPKFGSLLMVVNLSNTTCEKLSLINAHNDGKPQPPEKARLLLLNYKRNNDDDRLCQTLYNELSEGDEVNLQSTRLGPAQAAIFRYH